MSSTDLELHPHLIAKALFWREKSSRSHLPGRSVWYLATDEAKVRTSEFSSAVILVLFFVISQKGFKRIMQVGNNLQKALGVDLL